MTDDKSGYIVGGGPFPYRWMWFVSRPGVTPDEFEDLTTSDTDCHGFALTRWGARRRLNRRLRAHYGDIALEEVHHDRDSRG